MTESLSSRVAQFEIDIEIAHQIVHGTAEESVDTEGGQVRTFAKIQAEYDAQMVQSETHQNRVAAEAAAGAATVARDEAQLAAGIFPTIAAGLAATVGDEFFSVPSAESDEYLILYLNSAGAAIEQKRSAAAGRIAALEARTGAAESDIDGLQLQVAELLYVPPAIDALLIDGAASLTVEMGTSVASVSLSWTLSGSEPESQSIDQGVGGVPVGTTSKVIDGPFTASRTWALTVADTSPAGNPKQDSAAVSLNVRQKRYWGVVDALSLDSADILALASEFATGRPKTVAYDASAGGYPYYCYPAAWGAPSSVKVGGLAFSDYSITTQSFVNASGYAEDYVVIRFNVRQTGSNIEVQFA
ncbi:hypothetical protein [Azotobacter salinestris]|uniref:hypothetical protein n=1 Tax=Azotobacter salinestris TaxID=69964 RepID=UPI0032E03470